ncbi:MAG TPA: glutamyl-tRNA reductase [Candidatus Dormibacteraeota bacterium]|nr:glutamyl-tRNA reductase [Candidatus Dormibacteraeota bacterium]
MIEIVAAGLSFHTAPLAVRERAAVADPEARNLLRYLVGHSGLLEAAVVSTCNRTEFYLVSPDPALTDEVVPRLVRYLDPAGAGGLAEHLGARRGAEAVQHMFRVAAGLDSMVLGEAQILGQFKAAHRLARSAGTLDARLDFVMRRAVSVAKRVRTETGIARSTGSITELALDHAREALGGLEGRGILLVGAGKMSTAAARRLAACGARLTIASRSGATAEALAREVDGEAAGSDLVAALGPDIDLVICSTSSSRPVLTAADVERAQDARRGRPLCIVDIAVPRDVEPAAATVAGVSLVDLDVLGGRVESNLERRRAELPAAERIVAVELARTIAVVGERDAAGPTIAALARQAEAVRRREVERTAARLGLGDGEGRRQLDALTRSLVRKLLHAPITHIKDNLDDPGVALALREAFALDDPEPVARGRS